MTALQKKNRIGTSSVLLISAASVVAAAFLFFILRRIITKAVRRSAFLGEDGDRKMMEYLNRLFSRMGIDTDPKSFRTETAAAAEEKLSEYACGTFDPGLISDLISALMRSEFSGVSMDEKERKKASDYISGMTSAIYRGMSRGQRFSYRYIHNII